MQSTECVQQFIIGDAIAARLTQAVGDVSDALEKLGEMFIQNLSPKRGALLESILEPYVRAAEQLGPDASVPEIAALAKKLALRKT